MPIYTYRCEKCGKEGEFWLSINHIKPVCENCKCDMVRCIDQTSFILKGTGWAKDGYSKSGNGEALKQYTEETKNNLETLKQDLKDKANK